jgi:heme-degrading monooxygenase HmoA
MLFKLIVATVPSNLRARFADSQAAAWSELKSVPGFLAQVGGWETERSDCAVIIAYWKNEQLYADFMAKQHDLLAERQRDTYAALQINSGHVIMTIKESDPRIPIADAKMVRVTDLTLRPDSSPMFMAMQFEVWRPGLMSSSGMLGNTVTRLGRLPDRFASTTFWKSGEALCSYLQTIYPALSVQAKLKDHVADLVTYHAPLEPSWSVFAPQSGKA